MLWPCWWPALACGLCARSAKSFAAPALLLIVMIGKMKMAGKIESLARQEGLKGQPPHTASVEYTAGHKNMLHLIQLRWIAVAGQITTITIVSLGFGIALPLPQILSVLACLIAFNIGSHLRWHERQVVTNGELFHALLVDVGSLTALLYFSGGITNPFAFLYLLQVILSAVLLKAWSTWTIVAITSICLAGLALFYVPLKLPPDQERYYFNLYVQGMLICFVSNAALLAYFITQISRNFRARDAQLADLRQRATEEEHIVRMGLLASGAAHELGTPLATLSVIQGDLKRMPEFKSNAEQLEESRSTSPITSIDYEYHIRQDQPVVYDSALKQMILNVLDNALEASPQCVHLEARCEDDLLRLLITDAGPGFAPEMLAQFGKPYQSSKGRPGGGLGLFLSVNVARTLGGTVSASNREEGGAAVELVLPLAALSLEKEKEHAA